MKNKGFTLIELVIVLIIVAVLGTIGLANYTRLVEKARGAEAKEVLGTLRKLASAYYMQWNTITGIANTDLTIGGDLDQIPGPAATDCQASHWFWYQQAVAVAGTSLIFTATRCVAANPGKVPDGISALTLILTSNFNTGVDTWTGGGNY